MVTKEQLITALRTTSDGHLKGGNTYDEFILDIIEEHTNHLDKTVNTEDVHYDFSYMISELNKACKILRHIN